jgi:1,2-phenylacetyl-CoA epoxidase catalytic subunit
MNQLYKQILNEGGQELLDLILTVNVNFYFSELEIIEICAKWIPRRDELREKFYLVHHAHDEVSHSNLFKEGVRHLGLEWDDALIERYRLKDIDNRFDKLLHSDDELEVLIGLNVYAEGVLAMEELVEMSETKPHYFPSFAQIAREEITHLAFGKKVLERMFEENPAERSRAQVHCDWYRDHIHPYLWNDISSLIDVGVKNGVLFPDFRERAVARFQAEMQSLGLAVDWSNAAGVALAA